MKTSLLMIPVLVAVAGSAYGQQSVREKLFGRGYEAAMQNAGRQGLQRTDDPRSRVSDTRAFIFTNYQKRTVQARAAAAPRPGATLPSATSARDAAREKAQQERQQPAPVLPPQQGGQEKAAPAPGKH